jgi:hypothetical protein
LRKALIGLTPALFSLALGAQTATKPAGTAPSAPSAAAKPATPAAPAIPAPEHPITEAQVHELEELNGSNKLKDQLTEYFLRNFRQAPFMPKDVIDDLTASLAKVDVETEVANTYKKYISTEDATRIIEFYRSHAGKALIKAEPQINQEVQRNTMQAGQQAARAVIEKHRAEIDAAQKAWQQQHSGTPALGGVPVKPGAPASTPAKPATGSSTAKPATPPQP